VVVDEILPMTVLLMLLMGLMLLGIMTLSAGDLETSVISLCPTFKFKLFPILSIF